MKKVDINIFDGMAAILKNFQQEESPFGAALLVSIDTNGKPNVMTVHIEALGNAAGPIITVFVFEKRYSYSLLRDCGDFTFNVPRKDMKEITDYCGSASGRNHDKFKEKNLTAIPSKNIAPPIIGECCMHFECSSWCRLAVVDAHANLKSALDPANADSGLFAGPGDWFQGHVKAAYADEDVAKMISHG